MDNLLPPIIRDSKMLCKLIYRFDDGKNATEVIQFKQKLPFMSDEEMRRHYALRRDAKSSNRPTDLNEGCLAYILNQTGSYHSFLDAGGGRCWVAKKIGERNGITVTVTDMQQPRQVPDGIDFIRCNIKMREIRECKIT